MKKILLLIINITFSLCAIVCSEEETKDTPQSAGSEQASENTNEQKDSTQVVTNNSPINPNADLLQTGPRLSKEARRQDNVGRRARNIAKRMELLFLDLQSNGLIEEGNGDQLKQTGNLLLTVARKDVPSVADKLRQAQANIDLSLIHI